MKRLFSLSIIVIAALIFWGSQTWESTVTIDALEDDPHYITVFIHDFTITTMNHDGQPSYTLKARRLEHYNDDKHSVIDEPVLEMLQNDHRWTVVARSGEIADDNQYITLRDEVVIEQHGKANPIRLETTLLEIDTIRQVATSDRPVTITQRDFQLKSDGLILNNITGQLEFLSNVEGNYEEF